MHARTLTHAATFRRFRAGCVKVGQRDEFLESGDFEEHSVLRKSDRQMGLLVSCLWYEQYLDQ